jgi:hypothetical protein
MLYSRHHIIADQACTLAHHSYAAPLDVAGRVGHLSSIALHKGIVLRVLKDLLQFCLRRYVQSCIRLSFYKKDWLYAQALPPRIDHLDCPLLFPSVNHYRTSFVSIETPHPPTSSKFLVHARHERQRLHNHLHVWLLSSMSNLLDSICIAPRHRQRHSAISNPSSSSGSSLQTPLPDHPLDAPPAD